MNLSELVANVILELLEESDGEAEIQRNELASSIGCVPSQINYVITSRFTPELGYSVESRRGGGGYIKITRVQMSNESAAMHLINSVGLKLDASTAKKLIEDLAQRGVIENTVASVMSAACSDNALRDCPAAERDKVRAALFKQMLLKAI